MRTRTRRAWVVIVVILGLGIGWRAGAEDPRAFSVARETTFFTGPVSAEWSVDYVEALNARLSEGVTLADNAAVPLLEAAALARGASAEHYAKVRAKLGLPRAPQATGKAAGEAAAPGAADPFAGADPPNLERALRGPWTAEQAPEVAAWLKTLEPRLTLLVEASRRGQFYMPLVRERADDPMILILLPHLMEERRLADALAARAMLALGNEDAEAFRRDAVAVVRLGRLGTRAATMIERYVAIHCEAVGLGAMQVAAAGGWLSAEQAERVLADLRAAPAGLPLFEVFDLAERACVLELLTARAAHADLDVARFMQGTNVTLPPVAAAGPAQWDAALRTANAWNDRMREAGRRGTFPERVAAVNAAVAGLEARGKVKANGPVSPEAFAERVLGVFMSSLGRADVVETRVRVDGDLAEAALALSAVRAKSGEYPENLKELVPAYFKAEPVDQFTGRTLSYRTSAGGYVLQSLGANGRDDTGAVGAANDDRVVRAER